jgi:hypothetical protein
MRTATRKQELTSGSERLRPRVMRIDAHSSGLKLNLNVGWVNAFIKDRQRQPVIGFVKLVSTPDTCEYLQIRRIFVRLTWELASYASNVGFQGEKGGCAAYVSELWIIKLDLRSRGLPFRSHGLCVTSWSRKDGRVLERYKYVIGDLTCWTPSVSPSLSNRPTTKLHIMPEGVPVANLYYSDSPWSCAGESMVSGLPSSFIDRGFRFRSSIDSIVSVSLRAHLSYRIISRRLS